MINKQIGNVIFKLREDQDFSWLNDYGTIFSVIDETGSGCISFGIEKDNKKYFFKIAGAKTIDAEISEEESIKLLQDAVEKYKDIKDENLIKYVDSFMKNDCFVVVYEYAHGECLFDHWNFNKYRDNNIIETPAYRFKKLSLEKRLNVIEKLFIFFEHVIESNYVAVDFYDSSIIYDFDNDKVSFCDIDLFRKIPTENDLGKDYFGTKRLKAPEENELGAVIDERTNVFTLGAIIFDMLSEVKNNDERYKLGMFIHNSFEDFEMSKVMYNVLLKATDYNRNNRFNTICEFHQEFNRYKKD